MVRIKEVVPWQPWNLMHMSKSMWLWHIPCHIMHLLQSGISHEKHDCHSSLSWLYLSVKKQHLTLIFNPHGKAKSMNWNVKWGNTLRMAQLIQIILQHNIHLAIRTLCITFIKILWYFNLIILFQSRKTEHTRERSDNRIYCKLKGKWLVSLNLLVFGCDKLHIASSSISAKSASLPFLYWPSFYSYSLKSLEESKWTERTP